jgi:hypothetical protein
MTARSVSATRSRESQTGIASVGVVKNKVGVPENWRRESRLATLLHALDGLQAEVVPVVEEADREIWGYLSAFDGITSQTQALRHLANTIQSRPATPALRRVICNLLAQHRRRLADGSTPVTE